VVVTRQGGADHGVPAFATLDIATTIDIEAGLLDGVLPQR